MAARKRRRADGTLRPAVRRSRARRAKAERKEWLDQFKPGERDRFFKHVDLSSAVFLAPFQKELGGAFLEDRAGAARLLEDIANERGWRKLRTRDRTVVGIAPKRTWPLETPDEAAA